MQKIYENFLRLIKQSIGGKTLWSEAETTQLLLDYPEIWKLASIHKVVPLIYEASYKMEVFKDTDEDFQKHFKSTSMHIIYSQIQRSNRFIELYKRLNKEQIKVLVFKGIILRELYPIPDERISGDEDLLIKKADLKKVEEILKENGLKRILSQEEDEDVYHYFCHKTGLHLELHTVLFGQSSEINKRMDKIFSTVFDDSEIVTINNVDINTFSLDNHFLYIICHAIKHFISCGTGIRQLCDIRMYIDKYYNQINWNYIWDEITSLGYDTLFMNFLQICIDYLGLDESKITYTKNRNTYYINTQNLIEDIIDGGIYGSSYQARLNAANISLDAINKKNKLSDSKLAAIFPKCNNLKGRYKYLGKYPFLLPVAWCSRIYRYIKERGSLGNMKTTAKETMEVGNRRIGLLKEYKLIK